MKKILIAWSNYYTNLAETQLNSATQALEKLNYSFDIEVVDAGTYELPFVIQYYHRYRPYAGYLPLGLLLKGETDHYEFIWEHLKDCFTKFTEDGILFSNAVIAAPTKELLAARVDDHGRVSEAVKALDYLIKFKAKFL